MPKDGTKTKGDIIEKSLELFSSKGFFHTSVKDICKATGLTKGALYNYFTTKEEVWFACHEKASQEWRSIVFSGVRKIDNPVDRVKKVIENDLKYYIGQDVLIGGSFFFRMLVEFANESSPIGDIIISGYNDLEVLLASWLDDARNRGLLADGINAKGLARLIIVTLSGAAALFSATRDLSILDETIRQLHGYIDHLKL